METLRSPSLIFSSFIANGGKMKTLAQTMRDSGYSKSYARNPQKIKKTKVWKESISSLKDNDFDFLLKLREMMDAKKFTYRTFPADFTETDIQGLFKGTEYKVIGMKSYKNGLLVTYLEPDYKVQEKALDKIYKLRGLYKC